MAETWGRGHKPRLGGQIPRLGGGGGPHVPLAPPPNSYATAQCMAWLGQFIGLNSMYTYCLLLGQRSLKSVENVKFYVLCLARIHVLTFILYGKEMIVRTKTNQHVIISNSIQI